MPFKHLIGFGVAGNFAGHLEQAGEDKEFTAVKVDSSIQPKAIFPFYVPNSSGHFLNTYPISSTTITAPNDADNLQIEPEVALRCELQYEDNQVVAIIPTAFAAYNDCSIRRPNANKISEKKNWGENTKGVSEQFIAIDGLAPGGKLDQFRIASFHVRDGECHQYGEDSPVLSYSYFHTDLLEWIMDRMNNQQDQGPTEDIQALLKKSGYPKETLIGIGATRYTPYGETHFLKPGDKSIVVVYDGSQFTEKEIKERAQQNALSHQSISAVIQDVI